MANKVENPGAISGTELVGIEEPFAGWVSSLTSDISFPHYRASVEGVEAALTKPTTNNYAESDGITLFQFGKFGHIAPASVYSPVIDDGGQINQLALNGFTSVASVITSYVILKNGRIVQINPLIPSTSASYDVNAFGGAIHNGHTIASTLNPDMIIVKDVSGVEYVVWSWEDNQDADISVYPLTNGSLTGGSATDPWFSGLSGEGSTALSKGVPLKLCLGPDRNIYCTNGPYVAQAITTGNPSLLSATGNAQALNLGPGWLGTGILSYKNYIAVIMSSGPTNGTARGQVQMILWDGIQSQPNYIYPIPDNYANGIFFDGDVLYALTNGRNNTSKIFEFTGKAFKKVFESALIGTSGTTIQGSMESVQDSLLIGAMRSSQGRIFRFYSGGFHDEGNVTDGTNIADQIGMVKNLYQNGIFVGAHYGTQYLLYLGQNNSAAADYQLNCAFRTILFTSGILGRRLYPLGFKGSVSRIQLFLSQWGTGASIYLSLFKDYTTANPGVAGTDLLNILIDTNTSVPNGDQTGTNFFGQPGYRHYAFPVGTTEIDIADLSITDLSSFYMIVTFSHAAITDTAAIIRRALIHWEPSQ